MIDRGSKRVAVCKPRREASRETKLADTKLATKVAASRTMRNYICVV